MTETPKQSRHKMLWGGQWRSVVWMGDREGKDTTNPLAAVRAVLYVGEGEDGGEWIPTLVAPGEIVTREDASGDQQWELIE